MYYIHTDHLGSYIALTNDVKQVRQRNRFDPWGNYQPIYDTVYIKKPPHFIVENNFPLTCRGFTGHEHYPYFKIINMNGRLYDPVIARFFSPDKYVANSSFTQDFNRYSYARNCPLMYTDPDGESIFSGNSIAERFLNFLTLPARLLSEGSQWVNDKINGVTRPNGYFNWSYLNGRTEPGAAFNINNTNAVSYGNPYYISPTPLKRTGYGINADNTIADQFDFEWYWAGGTIGYYKQKGSNKQYGMIKAWGQWYKRTVKVTHDETDIFDGFKNALGTWSGEKPTELTLNGKIYVVHNATAKYINLLDKNLKRKFESVYVKERNIKGKYWSPIADTRGFESLMGFIASLINPISPPFPVSEIVPLPDALQIYQTPNIQDVYNSSTIKYQGNLLRYYKQYNIIK